MCETNVPEECLTVDRSSDVCNPASLLKVYKFDLYLIGVGFESGSVRLIMWLKIFLGFDKSLQKNA